MLLAAAALFSAAALAAPKLQSVVVKPNPAQFSGGKPPEVEVAVSVSRTKFEKGGCDARLDFGDGEHRTLDFGVAATRTVHHTYNGGGYTVAVSGTGPTPCEGSQQAALKVAGEPKKRAAPKKKAAAKKDMKKDESQ
jgi:hypothetical protein